MKRLSRALALTVLLSTITFPAAAQASLQDTLQEVVITATGTHHVLKDVPVQTEVITSRMLQNFAGRSLEDILGSLTASFAFNEDDMGSHIQMNGLGNSYILILIDGKRIHGDVGGENDLSLIDPNNIEKIEIVKGASSALYGSDAIAGVINVITRKHREEGLLLENVSRFGSYVDIRQHNAVGIHYGRFTSMTNFQLQHSDGWQNTSVEHTAAGEDPVTDSQNKTVNRHTNWQVAERLVYEPGKNLEMYVQGSIYGKRIYRPKGKYPRYDVHTYDLTYSNASASLGAKWKIGAYDGVTFDLDWNRHAYLYYFTAMTLVEDYEKSAGTIYYPYFPYLAGQSELESDQQRTMAALKGVFTLEGGHRLNTGAEYRYDWLHAPNRVAGKTASDHTAATYVQDEWKHDIGSSSQIQLAGGLRLTWNRQFGLHLTPKISAMLGLGEPWRLRATWSRGFKTPTPKELYYCYVRQMGGTYLYIGKGDLRPQSSDYFSFGGEYTAGGLSITATAYYNYVRDMIALVTIPNYLAPDEYIARYDPIRTRQYQNIEDARTRGVDVNVRYTLKEWAFGLGYSWLDTDANQYDSEHDRMHEVIIDGTAHHKGNCFVTWNHKSAKGTRWGSGLYGRMSSTRYYQLDGNGKGYNLWRLTGSCEPALKGRTSLRLEAGIDNIFDYVDRTPHGLHLGTTTPGRTIYGSITIRFNSGKSLKKYKTNIINSNHSKQNEED